MIQRNSTHALIALLTSALFATPGTAQTTWYVDDDALNDPGPGDPTISDPLEDGSAAHPFDAIQEGIDAAADGDTVLVLDGTYTGDGNRELDLHAQVVTVRSENGPETCTIDCEQSGRGFFLHSGEAAGSVLDGLTVARGTVDGSGGGILCFNGSSPTIANCVIRESVAALIGGGICCYYGSHPTITGCVITGNIADDPNLGGDGGGIACYVDSSPTIANCVISANTALMAPSGWEQANGGGIWCGTSCNPTIVNCLIRDNHATSNGGGLSSDDVSQPAIVNATFVRNSADSGVGGGVYCHWNSAVTISNSVFWENEPAPPIDGDGEILVTSCSFPDEGDFVDPDSNDFHLAPGARGIDAADNDALPPGVTTDLGGNPRIIDGDGDGTATVDVGAYEFTIAGDLDYDCDVDLSDLATLLAYYGTSAGASYEDGDIDDDGDVDLTDLAALLAVYGTTCD
jgi:hypothetical protein